MGNKMLGTWVSEKTANQVAKKAKEEGYVSVSDYIRTLIRKDLQKGN